METRGRKALDREYLYPTIIDAMKKGIPIKQLAHDLGLGQSNMRWIIARMKKKYGAETHAHLCELFSNKSTVINSELNNS